MKRKGVRQKFDKSKIRIVTLPKKEWVFFCSSLRPMTALAKFMVWFQPRQPSLKMRCHRKILRISCKDRVTNEEVRANIQQAIGPHEDLLTRRRPYHCKETRTAVVWTCLSSIMSRQKPCSGELRAQKLKSNLVRTQSWNVLPLKPGVGQYIAIHATCDMMTCEKNDLEIGWSLFSALI